MIDFKTIKLSDIMPPNLLADETVRNAAETIDIELNKITGLIDECYLINNLEFLPENIIDMLGWQWHVDYYDNSLPLPNKRRLVKESIRVHKTKGTAWAVENVVKSALGDSCVEEWYEYGGEPYHFRIICNKNTVGEVSGDKIIEAIKSAKNARSHLDEVRTTIIHKDEESANVYIGAVHVKRGRKCFPVGYHRNQISSAQYSFSVGTAIYKNGAKELGIGISDNLQSNLYHTQYSISTGTKLVNMEYPDNLPPKRYNINLETGSVCFDGFSTVFTGTKFIDTEYPDLLPEIQHDFDVIDKNNLYNGFIYSMSGMQFIDTEYPKLLPEKRTEYHYSEDDNIFTGAIYTTFGIKTINADVEENIQSGYDIAIDDESNVYAGSANINIGAKTVAIDIDEKSVNTNCYNGALEIVTGIRSLGVGVDSKADINTVTGTVIDVSGSKLITGTSELKSEMATCIGNIHTADGFKSINIKPNSETTNALLANAFVDSRSGSKTIGAECDYSAKYATDTIIKTDIFAGAAISVKKKYIIKEDK